MRECGRTGALSKMRRFGKFDDKEDEAVAFQFAGPSNLGIVRVNAVVWNLSDLADSRRARWELFFSRKVVSCHARAWWL